MSMTPSTHAGPPRNWAILNAHLIDGNPGGYAGRGGVVIEEGRIAASGPQVSPESIGDLAFVDAGNRTVMPGLIDCHAHLTWNALASPVATLIDERAAPVRLALRVERSKRCRRGYVFAVAEIDADVDSPPAQWTIVHTAAGHQR